MQEHATQLQQSEISKITETFGCFAKMSKISATTFGCFAEMSKISFAFWSLFGFTCKFLATTDGDDMILVKAEGDLTWKWCIFVRFHHRMAVSNMSVHVIDRVDERQNLVFTEGDGVVLRGDFPETKAVFRYYCAIEDPRTLCDSDIESLINALIEIRKL